MQFVAVSDSLRIHDTRHKPYFVIESYRTNARENSVNVAGPKLWDSLPSNIQNASYISSLKRLMLDYICNSYDVA